MSDASAPVTEQPSSTPAPASTSAETLLTPTATTETPAPEAAAQAPAAEAAAAEPAPDAAPDYAALTLPEGFAADAKTLDEFKALAGELKLPVEAAGKLLGLHARLQQQEADAWAATVTGWRQQSEGDPYLSGRDLANGGFASLIEATAAAAKALDRYGSPELRQVLADYGLGNHPQVVRFVARIGRDLSEDRIVVGEARAPTDVLRAMYPNSPAMFVEN